jgi:signal transduction histidine kinase/DNA-binding NarL/FixJ family response regulator
MEKPLSRIKKNRIFRYLGLASLFFVVIQIAFGIVRVREDRARRLADLEQQVENTAKFLAAIKHRSPFKLDDATLENLLLKTNADTTIAYGLALDAKGNIASSFLNQQMPVIAAAIKQQTYLTLDATKIVETLEQNATIREVRAPILSVGQSLGEIRIGYSLENIRRETQQLTQTMLVTSAGISILLTAAIAILFDREVRSPLRTLAKRATALSGETISSNNEFEQLSMAIHALEQKLQKLDRLKQHIVERKEAEKELENLSHAKSQFLATISHEIRTPLNAIAGMTGLLLDTKLNEEQKEFTDIIRISGERLLTMMNNILDFSKIEAKKLELEEQPFDLGECIEESLRMFLPQAAPKNLELAYLCEPQTPTTIIGDATRVRQILSNLLGNAVKFTESGEVVHNLPLVMLTSLNKQEICQQSQENNFAAIVSKPIQQSQLYGILMQIFTGRPLKVVDSSLLPSSRKILAQSLPLRILVAEDAPINQEVIRLLLEKLGYQADIVSNGVETLKFLRRQSYDVVLMDIQMPQMDGLEATRQICQEWSPKMRPRIIAMTAEVAPGDREKCLQAGMNDYIAKPIRLEELRKALAQCQPLVPREMIEERILDSGPRLSKDFSPERINNRIHRYLQEIPLKLEAIATAIEDGNLEAFQQATDALKTISANLGANRLNRLCYELDTINSYTNLQQASDKIPDLKIEYEKVWQAWQRAFQQQNLESSKR